MKHLIKFPLLALLCLATVGTVATQSSLAGTKPTTPATDAASVGIDFSPSGNRNSGLGRAVSAIASDPAVTAAVKASLTNAANQLVATSGSVVTVNNPITGASLEVPAVTAESVAAVLSSPAGAQIDTTSVASTLTTQIGAELPAGVEIDISPVTDALVALNTTPASLPKAVAALNKLIDSLDAEQLQAISNSPSFIAIRQVIVSGNSAIPN